VGAGGHSCACSKGHRRSKENAKDCTAVNKCDDAVAEKKALCGANSACSFTGPGKYACKCNSGFHAEGANKCVATPACAKNPCSKFAHCSADPANPSAPKCECLEGFVGDGATCAVKPGHKAIMLGGKMEIIPIKPGDTHDNDVAVLEAMLKKLSVDDNPVAAAIKPTATPAGPEPNADDQSKLLDVSKKVQSLEESARLMAEQTKAETAALMKLRESAAATKAEFVKAMEATTDRLADSVIEATHDVLIHTPHKAGEH
jgi:hypothetical protein